MKKYIVTVAISLSIATMAYGQFEIKGGGGVNFASLSKHSTGTEWASQAGYQFGAGVLIGDKFYVEPGIQFVRNARVVITESSQEVDFAQNLMKIPVYAGCWYRSGYPLSVCGI